MNHSSQQPDVLIQAAEALFRLGRLFSRVGVLSSGDGHTARAIELSRILIVQAVETVQTRTEQEVTIGIIAQQLAVEPSTSSRLVADTVKDGYIVRSASTTDSRRVQLDLTDTGRALAHDIRAYQLGIFRQVTSDWTESERTEFARLFVQFTEAVAVSVQARIGHTISDQ